MFQLLAHRRKDTVRSVCHAHESNCFSAGLIAAEGRWALVDEPEVTMPAGLRDRCLAWVDPRAEGRFGVDHPLESALRRREVCGRYALIACRPRDAPRGRVNRRIVGFAQQRRIGVQRIAETALRFRDFRAMNPQ